MRMGQNGYEGYKFSIKQKVDTDKNLKQVKKEDGDFTITFEVTVDHKDWLSIKQSEPEETFDHYKAGLGLYVCLVHKVSHVASIIKLSNDKIDDAAKL